MNMFLFISVFVNNNNNQHAVHSDISLNRDHQRSSLAEQFAGDR